MWPVTKWEFHFQRWLHYIFFVSPVDKNNCLIEKCAMENDAAWQFFRQIKSGKYFVMISILYELNCTHIVGATKIFHIFLKIIYYLGACAVFLTKRNHQKLYSQLNHTVRRSAPVGDDFKISISWIYIQFRRQNCEKKPLIISIFITGNKLIEFLVRVPCL